MAAGALTQAPSLTEGFALITSYWYSLDELVPSTQARFAELLAQATRRAERLGVPDWGQTFDAVVCEGFITARTGTAEPQRSARSTCAARHFERHSRPCATSD